MKPLFIFRGLLLSILFNLFAHATVYCQQINFSDSIGSYENSRFCTIVGIINNNYLIIESIPFRKPQYIILDTSCRLIKKDELSFIPPGGFIKAVILKETNSWNILWQSLNGGFWYLHNTYLSGNDNSIAQTKIVDSSILPLSVKYRPYHTGESGNQLYELLFRRIPDFENNQLRIELIAIEMSNGKVNKGQLNIPFNKEFDITGDLTIDNKGNVFTVVFDHPLNFKLSSGIRIYQYSPTAGQIDYPEIFSKQKKPANIFLQADEFKNRLVMVSLYTDFYTHNINGVIGAIISENTLQTDSLFSYSFPKELKKLVNRHITGIHYDKLMNYFELKDCRYNSEHGITILLELSRQAYNGSSYNSSTLNRSVAQMSSVNNNNILQDSYNAARMNRRIGGRANYSNYNPFNNSSALRDQSAGVVPYYPPEIPIQHITLVTTFDGQFHMTNSRLLENRLTMEIDYMPPYTFLKKGSLEQFVYDPRSSKPKLKQTEAAFFTDSLTQKYNWPIGKHWIVLNHPALYTGENFILSFYHDAFANSFGLAKMSWQQ